MKVLVIGAGSIGARHLRNILTLGHEVYAVDINKERLKEVSEYSKKTFDSLDEALKVKPEVAFICTFSNDHIRPAITCAHAGCHVFIEKPLSLNLDGTDALAGAIDKKGLISM